MHISWRGILTRLILAYIALMFIVLFPGDTPAGNSLDDRAIGKAKDVLFNYVAWEADAITGKIVQQQAGLSPYMTEHDREQYVHDYLKIVGDLQRIDSQIDQLYAKTTGDATAATADLRTQRDALQAKVSAQQPLAESIMEGQVASVLRDEGLSTLGEIIPPVSAHISDLPMLLVISPRDQVNFKTAVNLVSLTVDQQVALENSIDKDLNVSSLVVPIGGLSLYPSMVEETWYAPYAFSVVAHEWTHHYLMFFPLGLDYENSGEARSINETTASDSGDEISREVILRYYKDFPDIISQLPPLPTATPSQTATAQATAQATVQPTATPSATPTTPPTFDYGAEMNLTRTTVDLLLSFHQIDAAERYMEARRLVFVAHGYAIRKLNQAYFAFYGGYQTASIGASGTDPIGPAIAEIRQRTGSYKAWLENMRGITTRDELLAKLASMK